MVAAAQGADALRGAAGIDVRKAFQLGNIDLPAVAVCFLPHVSAVGDILADEGVQGRQVDALFLEQDHVHAAADVHAHQVRDHILPDGHGGADGAALPRVDVRHDPDLRPGGKRLIAKRLNLPGRGGLDFIGINDCVSVKAVDIYHQYSFELFVILYITYEGTPKRW